MYVALLPKSTGSCWHLIVYNKRYSNGGKMRLLELYSATESVQGNTGVWSRPGINLLSVLVFFVGFVAVGQWVYNHCWLIIIYVWLISLSALWMFCTDTVCFECGPKRGQLSALNTTHLKHHQATKPIKAALNDRYHTEGMQNVQAPAKTLFNLIWLSDSPINPLSSLDILEARSIMSCISDTNLCIRSDKQEQSCSAALVRSKLPLSIINGIWKQESLLYYWITWVWFLGVQSSDRQTPII